MADERAQIIAQAREMEDFETPTGPGAFEAAGDAELAMAIEVIHGHGFSDDQSGDTEFGQHAIRVGRYILWTDSQGFRTLEECDSEREAISTVEANDAGEDIS